MLEIKNCMYLPCIVVEIEDWSLQKLRRHAVTSLHVSHDMKQKFFLGQFAGMSSPCGVQIWKSSVQPPQCYSNIRIIKYSQLL